MRASRSKMGSCAAAMTIPLVADIHFFPPAAFKAADFVDKVRINPGNYADKRASFKVIEYDDATYAQELLKIEEKFTPLVEKCKKLNRSMRIGTNHGSLSDRIMNRYGDTPRGMVESAFEFARICRKNDYHDFLFSMKSSNPQVMIQAYRLLVAEMDRLGWDYPLHLGVTEAGDGEDGRIKSAMGIGALLLEGIGDTIRVSLTEDAWNEIDPCQRLAKIVGGYQGVKSIEEYRRRTVAFPKDVALHRNGTVVVSASRELLESPNLYQDLGCDVELGRSKVKPTSVDSIVLRDRHRHEGNALKRMQEAGIGLMATYPMEKALELVTLEEAAKRLSVGRFAVSLGASNRMGILVAEEAEEAWSAIEHLRPSVIFLGPSHNRMIKARRFFDWLKERSIDIPVILHFSYSCSKEDLVIQAAAECGALFCDGLGDGLWLEGPYETGFLRSLSFNILQAARMRIFKTDFISCPSCGRTLFDLQDVTQRIKARTAHLAGVKIAIMGCIVNGPGEMADADFGYVGSKPHMIDLYVGKQCVEKDIPFGEADDRLVSLIKAHGRWTEPVAKWSYLKFRS